MNLDGLNDMQKRAVKMTEGPLLVIAGAGSGKTRVLTHRIAYLIEDCGVKPGNILAITFTNKAAREMKERVEKIVDRGNEVWVSTFHSTCVRLLRLYIDRLGYDRNFTIYDTDDQKSVIKDACKKLNIDTKMLKERTIMSAISRAKDEMISPDEMEMNALNDYNAKKIAGVYREYQKQMKLNNALDFDDLLLKTVELFKQEPELLDYYQEKFKYIMVDEYQDTNTVQFKFVSMLADKYKNLCVVGDDDQSIYKFRGANITNILNFEDRFENARVIKLEQNYRSTKNILKAANSVIANNIGRKTKSLWTDNEEGDKINFTLYEDGYKEADGVTTGISAKVRDGWNYNDIAILYRTNAQSRLLEERLINRNIPYRIYGGVNFYQRKEIKDILAYLKTVDNGSDAQAVKRIINVPKRGIGATTLDKVQKFADVNDMSFWDALCNASEIPDIGRSLNKIENFVTMILSFKAKQEYMSLRELVENIIESVNYYEYLSESETKDEVDARRENIDELINKIISYENGEMTQQFEDAEAELAVQQKFENGRTENAEIYNAEIYNAEAEKGITAQNVENMSFKPTLSGFLSEVALVADIDNLEEGSEHVVLMTLHSAKGLEFPIVYMTGLEDGLFPSYMTIVSEDLTEVEEERRLCYVGITRAEKELYISSAKQRMVRGETQMNKVSRFVNEIPKELLNIENNVTGYNKSKIPFGGEKTEGDEAKFNFRANARAMLNAYGSGNVQQYASYDKRTRIEGKSPYGSGYMRNGTTQYGSGAYSTNYSARTGSAGGTGYSARTGSAGGTGAYSSASQNMGGNPGFGKTFPSDVFDLNASHGDSGVYGLGYREGDTVIHSNFGKGTVKTIELRQVDYMVTVDFESVGVKKMLAGFAKLKKA